MEIDLIHKECKYSFKGVSCKICPLKCPYKNKSKVILAQRQSIERLLKIKYDLEIKNEALLREKYELEYKNKEILENKLKKIKEIVEEKGE